MSTTPTSADEPRTTFVLVAGAVAVAAVATAVVALVRDDVALDLLRDPLRAAGVADDRPWLGGLSNVGVVLWLVAGTAAATAALALRHVRPDDARFLGALGVIAIGLGIDDLLLVHDYLIPHATGISRIQHVVIAGEGLVVLAFGWAFRDRIAPHLPSVVVIGACMAVSVGVDVLVGGEEGGARIVEDLAKLAGVAGLAVLAVRWSVQALQGAMGARAR